MAVRPWFLVVLTSLLLASACTDPSTAEPEPEPEVVSRRLTLNERPTSDEGPSCWISFANGERAGGCRDGELDLVEYANEEGTYVEGWNAVVSHMSVPDHWDVHSFHQMWANGEEENALRQGFVRHTAGTTSAFYQETLPVIRYVMEYNWDFCRAWNQEVFDANVIENDDEINDNMQCLHFEPDPDKPDGVLVIASDHPPMSERLEITYSP